LRIQYLLYFAVTTFTENVTHDIFTDKFTLFLLFLVYYLIGINPVKKHVDLVQIIVRIVVDPHDWFDVT